MFIKELSFPQTAPTDDAFFSTGTGLECVGVAGLDPNCWRTGMQAFGSSGLR